MKLARLAPGVLVPAALALAGAFATAFAGWPNDPGANFRFAPSPNDQWQTLSTSDGAGGVFIVWSESSDIWLQHVTAAGLIAPGWPASGTPVCTDPWPQYPSAIAPDGLGGCFVVWDDYRLGGSSDLYLQRVGADGTAHWAANGVPACVAPGDQWWSSVCSDRAGGALLTWIDMRDYGTQDYDVYAQRVSASGAPQWGAAGTAVSALANGQQFPVLVSDGTVGGAYIAWSDYRSGNGDIYATRLDGTGALRPGWTVSGTPVATGAWEASELAIVSDGAFGALIAWSDARAGNDDIFALRMTPQGSPAAGWPSSGIAICADPATQRVPAMTSDGAGGAIVTWSDLRNSNYDLYAQRVTADGSRLWTADGVPVCTAADNQFEHRIVSDGVGGALVAWRDNRAGGPMMVYALRLTAGGGIATGFVADGNALATAHSTQFLTLCSDGAGGAIAVWQHNGTPQQGFAQRIDRWGHLGVQPHVASVRDVPNDQGGRVKLSWDRSPLDAWPDNAITAYTIYRSVPPQEALAALASGAAVLERDARGGAAGRAGAAPARAGAGAQRTFVTAQLAAATVYWEYLADVSAAQLPGYSYVAATAQDSVPGSNPRTLFMVRAQDWYNGRFWDSDADSGYSTDDLAPAAPAPFTGTYAGGATHLHWQPNAEADLAHYRLYRGTSAGFVPGPGNLVASPPDTGYADAGAAGYFYKLTAVDSHGNESPASLLTPAGTLAVEGGPGWTLAFAPATPNPSSGATTCRFTLPAEGPVRVAVYDAAGRLVRVLADAPMGAGEHALRWDGEGEAGGRVPSGLYLARLSFAGRMLTRKLLRIR